MSTVQKVILLVALVALGVRLAMRFLGPRHHLTSRTNPAAYEGLRNQILHVRREQIGIPAPAHLTDPWAVVMDWGVTPGSTATVVAIAGGSASIYLSTGGGSIGGQQSHESIRIAAERAVAVAAEFQPQMHPVSNYPLPRHGEVTFYVRTDAGVFSASSTQTELSNHRHPLSTLGEACQEIITQYRLVGTEQ